MKPALNPRQCLVIAICLVAGRGITHAQLSALAIGPHMTKTDNANLYAWSFETNVDLGTSTSVSGHRAYAKDFTPVPSASDPKKRNLKSYKFDLTNTSPQGHCLEIAPFSETHSDMVLWFRNGNSWVQLSDDFPNPDEGESEMPRARVWLQGTGASVSRDLVLAPLNSDFENDEFVLKYDRLVFTESQCTTGSGIHALPWVKFVNDNAPVWGKAL